MEPVNTQNLASSGLDMHKYDVGFVKAHEFLANIVNISDSYSDLKNPAQALAYKIAFVHPEIKKYATRTSTYRISGSGNSLLGYIPDHVPQNYKQHPVIKQIEAFATGVTANIIEGNDITEGGDSLDNTATEQTTDQLGALKVRLFDSTNTTYATIDATGVNVEDDLPGLNMDSLFGYTLGNTTIPGSDFQFVKVTEREWEELELYEKWFYYGLKMCDSLSNGSSKNADSESIGKFVYHIGCELDKLKSNETVSEFVRQLCRAIAGPGMQDVGDVNRGADSGANFDQLLTAITLYPDARDAIVARYGTGIDQDTKDGALAALSDASKAIAMHGKRTDIGMTIYGLRGVDLGSVASDIHTDEATNLANRLSMGVQDSSILTVLANTPGIKETLNDRKPLLTKKLSIFAENPEYKLGLVEDPASEDAIDLDTVDPENDERVSAADANKFKKMANMSSPYEISRKVVSDIIPDKRKSGSVFRNDTKLVELDPSEWDVTGAYAIPKVAIPLFVKSIQPPKDNNAASVDMSLSAMVIATYIILAYTDPSSFGYSQEWANMWDEKISGTSEGGYSGEELTDIESLKSKIESYFAKLGSEQSPSVPINFRNEWVKNINSSQMWSQIKETIVMALYSIYRSKSNDPDYGEKLNSLHELADESRNLVKRYVFAMKENSKNLSVAQDINLLMASPLSPVNHVATSGTLRMTSGGEGVVTQFGRNIIISASKPKVTHVAKTAEGTKYDVSLHVANGKTYSASIVDSDNSDEMDTWMPAGLILTTDTDDQNTFYSVWVGLTFCSPITSDGVPENTLKVPEATVDTANAALDEIPANQATGSVPGGDTLKRFGKTMNSMTSGSLAATQDALAALRTGKISIAQAATVVKALADAEIDARKIDGKKPAKALPALNSTLAISKFSRHSTANSENVTSAVNELVALALGRHNKKYNTVSRGYISDYGPAIQGVSDTIKFCGKPHNDTYENTAERIKVALDAVLAERDGAAIIQWPFSVSYDKNPARMNFTAEKMDIPGAMPASIPSLATLKGIRDNIDRYTPEQLYTDTMEALKAARKTYTDLQVRAAEPVTAGRLGVNPDTQSVARVKTALKRRLTQLNSSAFKKAFAAFLNAVCPSLKANPEFSDGNTSILNFVDTIGNFGDDSNEEYINPETGYVDETYVVNAIRNQDSLATDAAQSIMASREKKQGGAELNKLRGSGKLDMLTGTAAEPYIGVNYDDDNSGNALSMAIDEASLADFDATANNDFMEVCEYKPMLGMVKCDPVGMKNGSGHLDVNAGLNPDEFATMVRALDSAYDEIVNHRSERYNTFADSKIQEFVKNRVAAYDNAIMTFYQYFNDNRIPAKRNLISDIDLILNRFATAVASCQDESMKPELNEASEKLTALYQHARSAEGDGNAVNQANRVASIMSTGFANVILHLNASLETSMVSEDIPNVRGNRDTGTMGNVNLALQTMHNPGKRDSITGKTLTRAQTNAFKKANAIVGKEIQDDLTSKNGEVDSLNTAYGHLGLDFTAGAMNSVSPFDDMIRKLGSKNANVYRKTYGGEAKTDLCTALLWAITEDESEQGNASYGHVEELVRCLQGMDAEGNRQPTQIPVNVRNFLLGGVRLDETGEDVDLDETVEVTFVTDGDRKGSAVPTTKGGSEPAMQNTDEVIEAAGLPKYTNGRQATSIGDLVRQIRTSIIEMHLADSRDILREVNTKAEIFGTERERGAVIAEYTDMLKREARTIKSDDRDFVPLSTLFAYSDLGSLNAAKWEKIKRAARVLIDTQDKSLYDRIMKDVFDDAEPEDLGERYDVESNRSAITGKIAEMFAQLKANPQADRDTVVNGTLSTPCEGTNGASLEDILGEDKAIELVTDAYEKFTANGLSTLDNRKLRIIADQITGIHCQTTGDIMASLANALYELGTGEKTYEDTLGTVTAELGQGSDMPAEQLVDAFIGKLGWNSRVRPAGTKVSDVAIRNLANSVVNGETRKNGEFRNIVTRKNPSDALRRINARKEMKGTHPVVDQEQLDPNSGADAMFRKLYNTLLSADRLDDGELKELDSTMLNTLKTRFTASQVLNDIGSVWTAMAGILGNTVSGIAAKLKANEISGKENPTPRETANLPKLVKNAHDRVCSDNPFNTTPDTEDRTLGIIRINGIQSLLDAIHGVVSNVYGDSVSGKSSHDFVDKETGKISLPGTGSDFADFINTFIARTTYWTDGTDVQTLAAKKEYLKDQDTLKAIEDKTKECIAYMYCWTPSRYQEASISALNAASMQRGMGEKSRTTREDASDMLEYIASRHPDIVEEVDSDAVDTAYIINNRHLDEEQAEGVINDALNMFAKMHPDEIINGRFYDSDYIVKHPDFVECLKRCSNPVKDYPLHSEEITALVMRYLVKKRFISRNGRGTILFKAMFKPRKGASRQWFTFILPFNVVTGTTSQIIGQTNVSNRGTDWNHFARELDNYVKQKTSRSEIERNDAMLSEEARNQLYRLVENVAKTITGLCRSQVNALDELETADMLRATKDSPYELGDFISVYPSAPAEMPEQPNPVAGIGTEGNNDVLDALVDIHRNRAQQAGGTDAGQADAEPAEATQQRDTDDVPAGEDDLPEVHGADGE